MPKRYFFYIPGTVFPVGSTFIKPIVGTLLFSQMVTPWATTKLIPIDANPRYWFGLSVDTAPESCHYFEDLYEHVPKEQRFYFQWSGDLGEEIWDENADFLNEELRSEFDDDNNEEIEIILLAHSHGGQIARKVAELMQDKPKVSFKIITVGTPLNKSITMPNNVSVWQHFYHEEDTIQHLGSFFMESWSSLIQPWSFNLQREMNQTTNPCFQNHAVTVELENPHNDMILDRRGAEFICEKARKAILGMLDQSARMLRKF